MAIDFLNPHDFQPLATALCWTLIHSLWQGLIVAMLTGIILLTTGRSRPALRYNLLAGLLLLFVVSNAFTFFIIYQNEINDLNVTFAAHSIANNSEIALARDHFLTQQFSTSFANGVSRFTDDYQMQIIMVWLTIFLFKSLRTVSGLMHLHRIRHTKVQAVNDAWNWQIRQAAARMGLYKKILLLESGILKVPVLQGFWRPVIIVPLGFFTSLPHEQVEAILLHEIAHVKRQDYLVNLLQSLAENIYFFNPAFLWLSKLIRLERENCCDELVIGVMKERGILVQALVAFQELRLSSSGLSFVGTSNHLLNRIKRIIYNKNKQLTTMETFSITSSLIAVAFISAVYFEPVKTIDTEPVAAIRQQAFTLKKATPGLDKPKVLAPTMTSKRIITNPKKLENDSASSISALLAELRAAIKAKDLKKAEQIHYKAYLLVWQEKSDIHSKRLEARMLADAFDKRKEQLSKNMTLANFQEQVVSTSSAILDKRNAEIDELHKEIEALAEENRQNRKAQEVQMQENLIEDLLAEGIITTRENLSYKLHNMFLIVNGVEQPESLHQKLKAKYLERSWTEWVYNWDGFTGLRFTGVRYNG
ncbi:M56 family metallopeptidase [Dyadobacter chenhuakuii]|uniref:M48 family metalloprotease n=1 Tax=Dyadobacter chenhuakuii TaxID=2909339 RepID=A0ABY4XQ03_9BACT|nr:M56 family metallopeptidase [Dyadobacter chenhuakuii]MCF2493182.1 M48 family metalloprotease [Dyadobacter chenhuakuii]USJ32534.1 M48 family metalloprotease [Dyadobacter chenhuakuii]